MLKQFLSELPPKQIVAIVKQWAQDHSDLLVVKDIEGPGPSARIIDLWWAQTSFKLHLATDPAKGMIDPLLQAEPVKIPPPSAERVRDLFPPDSMGRLETITRVNGGSRLVFSTTQDKLWSEFEPILAELNTELHLSVEDMSDPGSPRPESVSDPVGMGTRPRKEGIIRRRAKVKELAGKSAEEISEILTNAGYKGSSVTTVNRDLKALNMVEARQPRRRRNRASRQMARK